jgi:hypothetical protein
VTTGFPNHFVLILILSLMRNNEVFIVFGCNDPRSPQRADSTRSGGVGVVGCREDRPLCGAFRSAVSLVVLVDSRMSVESLLRASAMAKRLYVGNLKYTVTSEQLQQIFEQFGTVSSAQVLSDRETGRSRGFGFVEMANDDEAMTAIETLDGQDHDGRRLTVNEARPRTPGGGGGGGMGGGGYRGGGYRGGGYSGDD